MAGRIYIASSLSVIGINGSNQAFPMGLIENVRLSKSFVTEGVVEIGNPRWAEILTHGYSAQFSWRGSQTAGDDFVTQGLIPGDANIAQFAPIALRLVDQIAQRNIALVYKGVINAYTLDTSGRARLVHECSGDAISMLLESELN